ncbi:phage tail family protein [Bacillus altitudinis]|uniref:Phage tail family protein n=1 Tax=Bacillus altitudinis TaxID=293387 RepID=A0ABV1S2P0_BACAB
MHSFLLVNKGGSWVNTRDYGLRLLAFLPESLSSRTDYQEVSGRHGVIDNGTTFSERKISASFSLTGQDIVDYGMRVAEVYGLFATDTDIEIVNSRFPGKVWRVKVTSAFTPEMVGTSTGKFDIEFTSALPFAYSLGSSLDPRTFDADKWQLGQGLLPADDVAYSFSTTKFKIYNAGDVTIDPAQDMPLLITYKGASSGLKLTNKTTKNTVFFSGTTNAADTMKFKELRILKNDSSVFSQTNRKYISLAPGWNDFELSGTSGTFTISFDFHFFYRG